MTLAVRVGLVSQARSRLLWVASTWLRPIKLTSSMWGEPQSVKYRGSKAPTDSLIIPAEGTLLGVWPGDARAIPQGLSA